MLKILLVAVLLLNVFPVLAQELTELEKRNGFKNIKLAMPVDSVHGTKFKKDIKEADEFDAKVFEVDHPDYKMIGEVEIRKVELKAYKGLIYEISVITPKDPRLMKALESIYGQAEYDLKKETYFWKGANITLKFRSHSKQQLEMVYNSILVRRLMKTDKEKKVEAIANDF
jgi:hypothetical protein